jgi:hypothetical protein
MESTSTSTSATDPETLQKWRDYYQTVRTLPLLTYRPLDQTKRQIRLLTPISGEEDPLNIPSEHCLPEEQCAASGMAVNHSLFDHPYPLPRFTLEEVSLAENPSYSAFSYVWGDAQSRRAILVDDRVHLVTKNLFSALIKVELPTSKIWIDAICINQEDDDEKSWQVQQMREIYEQAEYTAAWLGTQTEDCDVLVPRIVDYTTPSKYADIIENPSFEHHGLPIAESLDHFSTLEYWGRVWIQQEQHASKNVQFHWGTKTFSCNSLLLFVGLMQRILITEFAPTSRLSMSSSHERNIFVIAYMAMAHFVIRTQSQQTMLDLMRHAPGDSVRATDSRDRVYAFMGMVSDAVELAIKVDYKKDWRQVFTDFAVALFNKEGPKVFDLCGISASTTVDPELPSWAPDLTRPYQISLHEVVGGAAFRASRNSKAVFEFVTGSKVFPDLSICGTLVDTILATSTENIFPDQSIPDCLSKLEELALKCGDKYGSPQDRASAVWRVPVLDHIVDPESNVWAGTFEYTRAPSDETLEKMYNYIRAGGEIPVKINNEVKGHMDARVDPTLAAAYVGMFEMMTARKYFVSKSGYLGMGSSAAAPGDLVVLIFGCGAPYLLRPHGDGKYRLIGDTYVHGIMGGELLAQSYTTQSFTIC